jgi:heme exporter protein A
VAKRLAEGLEARNLQLWRGDRCLFRHLDISVGNGRLVHVQGRNGAGKTSLMRILCGLVLPDDGEVLWRGRRIDRVREAFHQALAWLGHRDGLKQDLTAIENLCFGNGLRRAYAAADARAALDEGGLDAIADLPVRALSAGQRRRVAFARVQSSGASLWLLDEPFANLDAAATVFMAGRLSTHLAGGGSIVLAAHRLPAGLTEHAAVPLDAA